MRAGKRVSKAIAALLLFAAVVAAPEAMAGEPSGLGRTVSAIELRLDAPVGRRADPRSLVAVRVGAPLSEQAVRRTISNLQATGLFSEVEVLSRRDPPPAAGGRETVTVVVVLRARTWVSSVELRRHREPANKRRGISNHLLLRAITQKQASPLVEERVLESVYALKDLYREHGYHEAEVRLEVEPGKRAAGKRAGGRVVVAFRITRGPRAVVAAIDFAGELGPYRPAELRSAMRARIGERYRRGRIEADSGRLDRWLRRRGHLSARVGLPREVYDPEHRQMRLTYPVTAGPEIDLRITGMPPGRLKRKGFLPFLKDESLDALSLEQQCLRLEAHLQSRGPYHAQVHCALEQSGQEDHRLLRIDVDPGQVYRLVEVGFVGNDEIPQDELLTLMTTSPRNKLSPGSGRLIQQSLEDDFDNIRSYYLLQGFGEVEVGTVTVNEEGRRLGLEIEIREGPRQRLVDFTFSGLEILDLDRVRASLPLKPGGPYHPVLLDDSLNIVRSLYEDQGFPSVTIIPRLDRNDERGLLDVHFEVDEGPQAVVDRLILRGQRRSKTDVVRRFVRLKEGEPVSRRRLLEVERDLYRLGIFSKVDVESRPVAVPSVPPEAGNGAPSTVSEILPTGDKWDHGIQRHGSTERRDVVIRLEEGNRYRLAYGFSYHSDDGLGGLLSITRANLGGRGDRLQLDLRGNQLDRRLRLLYDQPLLWHFNLPVTYSLFSETQDRDSFSVTSLGAQIAVTKDLPSVRLRGVMEYRSVDIARQTIDFDNLEPGDIEREDREVEILSLIPIFYLDRRNDPLDPERGWSSAVQLEYAVPFEKAEIHFLKLFWQQTHYLALGRAGNLAASFRLGAIEPLDPDATPDPLVPADLPNALVPVSERFFAGGRTSHRAYDRDQLGIPGRTLFAAAGDHVEVGGNGLVLLNLDYRFPIAEPVGGIVFLDYGNVWADWRDLDAADLKPGAGLGLRYASPIGPVRLEIGWKLEPGPGEDNNPVFFLSFGNPF